jgi:NAD(P)-dependent dehydrogenase (short-subunit alcohol dehydrogenase family)
VKGKTVVITGGTSGIGEVAAEALAQIGARIILVARSKSRAEATLAPALGKSSLARRFWPGLAVRGVLIAGANRRRVDLGGWR